MSEQIIDVSKRIQAFGLELVSETIENLRFELLELTPELKASLKTQSTYEGMIDFAADAGVSIGRDRADDNEKYKEGLESVWQLAAIQEDEAGTIKKLVGEKVCEISGLSNFVDAKNQEERQAQLEAEKQQEEINIEVDPSEMMKDAADYTAA